VNYRTVFLHHDVLLDVRIDRVEEGCNGGDQNVFIVYF
jgi:hypothetical protein